MAALPQTVPKLIRNLKDSGKISLQCGALTYIRSNAEKLETTSALKEEEYSEICRLIIDMTTNTDQNMKNEATKTLEVALKHFKSHSLKFFESALQINRKKRISIFSFLENVDDETVFSVAEDPMIVNFMNDCMHTVETNKMEWLLPSSCPDNLQMLTQAESRALSDDQEMEELMNTCSMVLLQRLYKIAATNNVVDSTQRFDTLLMDKVVTLAYMGHKRQRPPAIKLLHEAIGANLGARIRTKYADVWTKYKSDLQGPYCTRMALLVKTCEMDWAGQWSISIQLLGTDLHRGATLINNLLSVEERAFKSTDTNVRRQAFVSWKLLIDNFALDPKELATPRRIKLLCVPLTAKNSKSELIALTKLEVWWYLITKLYPNITKFAEPVITQFLNFCFGPLGDTPLLSTKVDVIASPGKRFYKTKVVAIDALLQLMVLNQEDRKALVPILEERLTHPVTDELFKECYKAFLHSIGEAVVIVSQLHESEMRNREDIMRVLLTSVVRYVRSTSAELKAAVHNELILVVTELLNRSLGVPCIDDFIRDAVLPELSTFAADLAYREGILKDLTFKVMTKGFLKDTKKKHCEAIKWLLWQAVKPKGQTQFHSETLQILLKTLKELESVPIDETGFADCFELWFTYAEIAQKYASTQEINEGTATEPNFTTIESIVRFPFAYMYSTNSLQAQKIAVNWKDLYKQFDAKADAIAAVKQNEIFETASKTIQDCLVKNEKCYRIAVYCLDALLSTINYKELLAQSNIPTIVKLVNSLTTISLHDGHPTETDCALKALSSLLITVYGLSPEKSVAYLTSTSQAIELMLKTDAEDTLIKEVTSTWETVVSILRGLNTLLDADFLGSYKEIILLASRHSNSEIVSQAEAVIALKDNLKDAAKAILVEVEHETKKTALLKIKSDKAERTPKQVKLAGSFLNRKVPSPRLNLTKLKTEEKKLIVAPPEPDSQDYVVIKSDVKVDVNRLTEHQKESLKRRRDDIPAMYNDLSQSSSQDTQDLQRWFEGKAKQAEQLEKKEAKAANDDEDPNKENKIDKLVAPREEKPSEEPTTATSGVTPKTSEENSVPESSPPASLNPSGQEPASHLPSSAESPKEAKKSPEIDSRTLPQVQISLTPVVSPLKDHSYVESSGMEDFESPDKEEDTELVPKKLNFESREEYPEGKEKDKNVENASSKADTASGKSDRALRSNKVAIDGASVQGARRMRTGRGRSAPGGRELRNSNSESQDQSSGPIIRTRGSGRSRGGWNRRSQSYTASERGVKRKAASDSESEGSERSKRLRRKSSRSPSGTPTDSESSAPNTVDKRTESEMSRLRIDMVFDGPLPSRRRSKAHEELAGETLSKRLNPESRTGDNSLRRSLRGSEKEGGSVDSVKKPRRKYNRASDNRAEGSKDEEDKTEPKLTKITSRKKFMAAIRKMLQDGGNSVSQTIVDDEETPEEAGETNTELEKSTEDGVDDPDNIIESEATPELKEVENDVSTSEELTADDDEVIESSQKDLNEISKNRKSIISALKLSKSSSNAEEIKAQIDSAEPVVSEALPRASSPIGMLEEPMETEIAEKDSLVDDKIAHDDLDETFLDISAIRAQPAEELPTEEEKKDPEDSKTNGAMASSKTEPSFNFSSPKNPSRRFLKPKGFAGHGRAAHMLGLVTNLAALEKDCEEKLLEDESSRKSRTRDTDGEPPAKKERPMIYKDSERIGSPGGSRQEKIFNNMKAADYAASPPGKLFGNLKNNGERISPKMGKIMEAVHQDSEASGAKDDEEDLSQQSDMDELPILEWSSANPPSLTASPSVSILKRIRQVANDQESETTPTKSLRKRVSFADPPVSKEMGYEVASGGSPMKVSKFTSRSLFDRKNSPLRLKQSRLKMIHIDAEKVDKEEDSRILGEVDMDCERENALLVKIAEDLEDTAEFRAAEMSTEASTATRVDIGSREEVEINVRPKEATEKTEESTETRIKKLSFKAKEENKTRKQDEEANLETQDDLFNSSDDKTESPKKLADATADISKEPLCTSTQNTSADSLKLNVTDDSVIGGITRMTTSEHDESQCLEDTVDVRNITSLNSTANSDEMFCERPPRTSTEAPEGLGEMDTLPVTDSIFASLPITQDSQDSTQASVDLPEPELLNSTEPIYPKLVDCREPIESIVNDLANPLWVKNLSTHLEARSIRTVGDLAKLSEREVFRIPVKGVPKVGFVRKVLRRFEDKRSSGPAKTSEDKNDDFLALVPDKDASVGSARDMDVDELPTLDVSSITTPASQETQNDSTQGDESVPVAPQPMRRTSTTLSSIMVEATTSSSQDDTTPVSQMDTVDSASVTLPGPLVSAPTEPLPKTATKSVGSQITLEDLLDEVDLDLILQSALRRCSAAALLAQYKTKMGPMTDSQLFKETIRMLAFETKVNVNDSIFKAACRECGLAKILARLPEIFGNDKQFVSKVLNAYRRKLKVRDFLEVVSLDDVKEEIWKRCSPLELAEMLSKGLQMEEGKSPNSETPEVAKLTAMLKKMPVNLIVSHTIANDKLIPASYVLGIALQNNSPDVITKTMETQYPEIAKHFADKNMTPEGIATYVENTPMPREKLLSVHKAVCSKLSPEDLLDAYHEAMKRKLSDNSG